MKEIAQLYGCDSSLEGVEEYRSSSGLELITAKCLKAARISTLFIDDGLELDKMHDIHWHKTYVQSVARILRIERQAEKILDQVFSYFKIIALNQSLCIFYIFTLTPNLAVQISFEIIIAF